MEELLHALESQHAQVRLVQGTPWLEACSLDSHVHANDLFCGSGSLEGVEVNTDSEAQAQRPAFVNWRLQGVILINSCIHKEAEIMKIAPISARFERLVVEPIENGYLATISTEDDERTAFFKSLPRALKFLSTANDQKGSCGNDFP